MRSLEDLYNEVQANEELKMEFVSAFKAGKTEVFLKAHDCKATVAEVMEFIKGTKDEAVTEDDLAKVAGGGCSSMSCHHTCDCYSIEYLCL